jgi:hypothetical protein
MTTPDTTVITRAVRYVTAPLWLLAACLDIKFAVKHGLDQDFPGLLDLYGIPGQQYMILEIIFLGNIQQPLLGADDCPGFLGLVDVYALAAKVDGAWDRGQALNRCTFVVSVSENFKHIGLAYF